MRNLLIINENRSIQMLLNKMVLSELGDFCVTEASSSEEALEKLQKQKFNVVISANETGSVDGASIFKLTRELPENKDTPFILMTSSQKNETLAKLKNEGIEHYLVTPFDKKQLSTKINLACNPIKLRTSDRINIPGVIAKVHMGDHYAKAKAVNMSSGGILCDLDYSHGFGTNLLKETGIAVAFPKEYSDIRTRDISSKFLRLEVLPCNNHHSNKQVRASWRFVDVSNATKKIFEFVFQKARKDFDLFPIKEDQE